MGFARGEKVLFRTENKDEAYKKAYEIGARVETRNKPHVRDPERALLFLVIGYE